MTHGMVQRRGRRGRGRGRVGVPSPRPAPSPSVGPGVVAGAGGDRGAGWCPTKTTTRCGRASPPPSLSTRETINVRLFF